jgi:ABC-type thiamine transport system ATPase subunit
VLDGVLRAAPSEGRTVLVASHELDRARALARREVAVVAGQVAGAHASAVDAGAVPAPAVTVEALP